MSDKESQSLVPSEAIKLIDSRLEKFRMDVFRLLLKHYENKDTLIVSKPSSDKAVPAFLNATMSCAFAFTEKGGKGSTSSITHVKGWNDFEAAVATAFAILQSVVARMPKNPDGKEFPSEVFDLIAAWAGIARVKRTSTDGQNPQVIW